MNTKLIPSLILVFTFILITAKPAKSQEVLEVTNNITPEEMVELLIGSGLDYSNVVYTGNDISRGSFWNGPGNIGVTNGIILTSGSVNVAPGPNNAPGAGANANQPGDPDLSALAGCSTFDACVLEFDFVPYYEHVWFDYVFCSEEYHEYVGQFNDAFGFFISGPGISGPHSNNSANIALIPDTDIPISINTVNCGNPFNCDENCTNCEYFKNNYMQFVQYDAMTTVLTAEAIVEPMSTYHIKLAIGDGLDHAYDSGVLLQASSFCSGPVTGLADPSFSNKQESFSVYPVPAGNEMHINAYNGQTFTVEVIGQDGRTWKTVSASSSLTLDLSDVPAGMYFLRITGRDGVETKKIFRQ